MRRFIPQQPKASLSSTSLDSPSQDHPSPSRKKSKSKFFTLKPTSIQPPSKGAAAPAAIQVSSSSSDVSASTSSSSSLPKTPVDSDSNSVLDQIQIVPPDSNTGLTTRMLNFFKNGKGKRLKSGGNKGDQGRAVNSDNIQVGSVATGGSSPTPLLGIHWRPRSLRGSPSVKSAVSYKTPSPLSIPKNNSSHGVHEEDDDEEDDDDDDEEEEESDMGHPSAISLSAPNSAIAPPPASFMLYPPSPTKGPLLRLPNDRPPPRSHSNLIQLTQASLQTPPSPNPFHSNNFPSTPLFPRSINPSHILPSLQTTLITLHKNRVLQRLESNALTAADELSIMSFTTRRPGAPRNGENGLRAAFHPQVTRSRNSFAEEDSMRRIDVSSSGRVPTSHSRGLRKWVQRSPFTARAVEWSDRGSLGYRWILVERKSSGSHLASLDSISGFSKGLLALAGSSDVQKRITDHAIIQPIPLSLPRLNIPPVPLLSSSPSPSGTTSTAPTTPKAGVNIPLPSQVQIKGSSDEDDLPLGMISPRHLESPKNHRSKETERERALKAQEKALEKEAKQKKAFADQIAATRARRESYRAGGARAQMDFEPAASQSRSKSLTPQKGHRTRASVAETVQPSSSSVKTTKSRRTKSVAIPENPFLVDPNMMMPVPPMPAFYGIQSSSPSNSMFPALPPSLLYPYTPGKVHRLSVSSQKTSSRSETQSTAFSAYSSDGVSETGMSDTRSFKSLPRSLPASNSWHALAQVHPVPPLPSHLHGKTIPRSPSSPVSNTMSMSRQTPWTHRRTASGDASKLSLHSPATSNRQSQAYSPGSRPRTIVS